MINIENKTALQIMGCVVIIAAILKTDYHLACRIILIAASFFYLVNKVGDLLRKVRSKSITTTGDKMGLASFIVVLYVFSASLFFSESYYFLMIVALGLDYYRLSGSYD